jgi:hypothetical protein
MKTNLMVVTTWNLKMLVNASNQDLDIQPTIEIKIGPLVDVIPVKKGKHVDGSFFFSSIYSVLLFIISLINGVW